MLVVLIPSLAEASINLCTLFNLEKSSPCFVVTFLSSFKSILFPTKMVLISGFACVLNSLNQISKSSNDCCEFTAYTTIAIILIFNFFI